jgi:hypothetical protein
MPLFTFFLEYKGGTYISQVRAQSYKSAPKVWAEKLDLSVISQLERDFKRKLQESVDGETPTPLKGIDKTWCCSLLTLKETLVHFVQTCD